MFKCIKTILSFSYIDNNFRLLVKHLFIDRLIFSYVLDQEFSKQFFDAQSWPSVRLRHFNFKIIPTKCMSLKKELVVSHSDQSLEKKNVPLCKGLAATTDLPNLAKHGFSLSSTVFSFRPRAFSSTLMS